MLCLRCGMNHFLAASWTISISLRRDQDGAGLIRPSHRLDDETGERILLRRGRMKVWGFLFYFIFFYVMCHYVAHLALPNLLQTRCVLWAWHPRPSASALHSRLDKRPVLPVEYIYRRRKVEDMCPHTAARQPPSKNGVCACGLVCAFVQLEVVVARLPEKTVAGKCFLSETVMHASSLFEDLDPHFLNVKREQTIPQCVTASAVAQRNAEQQHNMWAGARAEGILPLVWIRRGRKSAASTPFW